MRVLGASEGALRKPWAAVVTATGVMLGCGEYDEVELETAGHIEEHERITNGYRAYGMFPAVGFVYGAHACTGTLITHRAFLTAAHCVNNDWQDVQVCLDGPYYSQCTTGTPYRHPDFSAFFLNGKGIADHDVAVVVLHENLYQSILSSQGVAIEPMALKFDYPGLFEGMPIVMVGYGKSETSEWYPKYYGYNKISKVRTYSLEAEPGSGRAEPKSGDSGGPWLYDSVCQVGVFSGTAYSLFGGRDFMATRVDAHILWIWYVIGVYYGSEYMEGSDICNAPNVPPPPPPPSSCDPASCGDGVCCGMSTPGECEADCPGGEL